MTKRLTYEQIDKAWRSVDYTQPYEYFRIAIARAIEAAVLERSRVDSCPHCGGTKGHWEGCKAPQVETLCMDT